MKKNQVFDATLLLTIVLFWSGNLSAQWTQNNFSIWNANLNKNVGIGTTNPAAKLSVVGNNIPTLGLHNSTIDYARIRLSNVNNGFWDLAGVVGTTDTDDRLNFFHNAVGNILSITGAGNVGIGTVNPTVKLQVEGVVRLGPQSSISEGGEIQLSGSGSNPMWNIDAFNDRFRIFSGSEKITILQNGNVGIGTTSPTAKLSLVGNNIPTLDLHNNTIDYARIRLSNANNGFWDLAGVVGTTDADDRLNFFHNAAGNLLSLTGSGNVGIGTTAPTYKLDINGTARCVVMLQTSDRRYKINIRTLNGALDKILAMRGTTYDFTADQIAKGFAADQQVGFIAQEMQKVMPELVKEDTDGMLAINYTGVIPVLVEALKDQHEVIRENEARIIALEAQNNKLQDRLARIEAALGTSADRQSTDLKTNAVSAKINPNPTAGLVTVELQNTATAKKVVVKIIDAAGREVANRSVASGSSSVQFDLTQFPAGLYVAQVVVDGRLVSSNKVQLVK